jgi:hypothetical protein
MGVRGISPELANAILVKAQSSVAKFRLLRNITEAPCSQQLNPIVPIVSGDFFAQYLDLFL